MDTAAKLLVTTVEQRMALVIHDAFARIMGLSFVMLLAGACAAAGLGCVLTGLWLLLLPHLGAVGAAFLEGAVLLLASAGLLAWTRLARTPPPPAPEVEIMPRLLLEEVTELLKNHKGPVLMGALLAGLFAGRSENG